MSSYFSSFASSSTISNISTRLTSLRRAITSGEEYDDPDNEDCSHVSNVLRAYYAEKGRPFPPWLPPDPKGPPPAPARVIATSQLNAQSGYAQPSGLGSPAVASGRPGGGLSELWGDSAPSSPQLAGPQTSSLRTRRPAAPSPSTSQLSVSHLSPRAPSPSGRPVIGNRSGSAHSSTGTSPRPSMDSSAPSAQERLRARLQGGSRPSSSTSGGSHSPASQHNPLHGLGGHHGNHHHHHHHLGNLNDNASRKPVGSPGGRTGASRS